MEKNTSLGIGMDGPNGTRLYLSDEASDAKAAFEIVGEAFWAGVRQICVSFADDDAVRVEAEKAVETLKQRVKDAILSAMQEFNSAKFKSAQE